MRVAPGWSFAAATAAPLVEGEILLWWLGQAGFLLRGGGGTLLVDPYLTASGTRRFPPPFPPADAASVDIASVDVASVDVASVDAVLITHEHGDHLDADVARAFAEAGSTARWVVPEPVADRLTALGLRRELIVPAQPGRPVTLGPVTVHPLAAHHGMTMADAYGTGADTADGLVRFLGYVADLGGVRLYHSGDSLDYPGLAEELARLSTDVVLLPINGRDAARESRGIVGNMTADEAVDLAARSGAEILVPMHWDMFETNPGHPSHALARVERDHPQLTVLVPSRYRPVGLHLLRTPRAEGGSR